MYKCDDCGKKFESDHYCSVSGCIVGENDSSAHRIRSEEEKLVDSAVIGFVTNSSVAGALLGGSLLGGVIGSSLRDDD